MGDGFTHQPLRATGTIGHIDSPRSKDRLQTFRSACDNALPGCGDSVVFTQFSPSWKNHDSLRSSRQFAHPE